MHTQLGMALALAAGLGCAVPAAGAPTLGPGKTLVRIAGPSADQPLPPTRPAETTEANLAPRLRYDVFAEFARTHPDVILRSVPAAPFSPEDGGEADLLHLDPSENQLDERVGAGQLMVLDKWVLRQAFKYLEIYRRHADDYNRWVAALNSTNAGRVPLVTDKPAAGAALPAATAPSGYAWGPLTNYDYDYNEAIIRYNLAAREANEIETAAEAYQLLPMRRIRLPEPLTVANLHPALFGFSDAVWQIVFRVGPDKRRHVYAWPGEAYVLLLQTNRDTLRIHRSALRDADIDSESLPLRWRDLFRISYVLTDPDEDRYGFLMEAVGWHVANFLWQAGGDVLVPKRAHDAGADRLQWAGNWHRPPGITTARFLRRLFNKYKVGAVRKMPIAATNRRRPYQYRQDFFADRCAMRLAYGGNLSLVGPSFDRRVDLAKISVSALPAGRYYDNRPFEYEPGRQNLAVQNQLGRKAVWDQLWTNPRTGMTERQFRETQATRYYRRPWVRFARPKRSEREARAPLASLINYGGGWRIRATEVRADVLAINAKARRDPALTHAAQQFIAYYGGAAARKLRLEGLIAHGRLRQISSRYLIQAGKADLVARGAPPAMELAVAESLCWGRPQVHGPRAREALALLWEGLRKTIFAPDAEKKAMLKAPSELEDKPEQELWFPPADETEVIIPLVQTVEALDRQLYGDARLMDPPEGARPMAGMEVAAAPPSLAMWLIMLAIALVGLGLGIWISIRRWGPRRRRPLQWDRK